MPQVEGLTAEEVHVLVPLLLVAAVAAILALMLILFGIHGTPERAAKIADWLTGTRSKLPCAPPLGRARARTSPCVDLEAARRAGIGATSSVITWICGHDKHP